MQIIQCSSPKDSYLDHKKEINDAVLRVLNSANYVLGPEVQLFEQELAEYNDAKFCIGVNSGTDALILSLKALGINENHEVITTAHTALATISAILAVGATPILCDLANDSYLMNIDLISNLITSKTKAVIGVHLYGQALDLNPLVKVCKKHKIYLIEDCAQAIGASYKGKKIGSYGDVGCFSFYPTKNLGAIGDGGAVITSNEHLAKTINKLRQYGWDSRRIATIAGNQSRLDEIQAAILRVKLKYLDQDNQKRIDIAKMYSNIFNSKTYSDLSHVYHLYVINVNKRAQFIEDMNSIGIVCGIHYPVFCYDQPGYKNKVKIPLELENCKNVSEKIVTLPIYPQLDIKDIKSRLEFWIDNDSHKELFFVM